MMSALFIQYTLVFVASYLFGSIPWGLIIGKCKGIDIRQHGSGNIGATNVLRTLGKPLGVLCFFLDFLKGLIPVLIAIFLLKSGILANDALLAPVLAGFAAFAGHVWSLYLKFKGGKGVATSAGIIAALAPVSLLISGVLWLVVFKTSRYVSLASICASVALPVSAIVLSALRVYELHISVIILLVVIGVLAIIKHRGNIQRLLAGTENRFDSKKNKK